MKHKKLREIAFLTLPILALMASVPIITWFAHNRAEAERKRAARQEWYHPTKMRIELCELRAASAFDAYRGNDAELWTRSVAPVPPATPEIHWRTVIEVRDLYGVPVETYGRGSYGWNPPQDARQVREESHPLNLNDILGEADSAHAHVTFEKTDANGLTLKNIARDFTLKRPKIVPLASRRVSNFTIEKIGLQTKNEGGKLRYTFTFAFAARDRKFGDNPWLYSDKAWVVAAKDGSGSISMRPFQHTGSNPDKQGKTTLRETCDITDIDGQFAAHAYSELVGTLPPKPATMDLLLSGDSGWPQNIHIELPRGLPLPGGKPVNLPFRATLAPLPK